MNRSVRSKGGVTVADVAQLAGVSAMTVSRVVNGAKKVSEETRATVLQAVKQLGYAPNLAARTLASRHPTAIGLVHSNPSAAYLSKLLLGALDAASKLGCELLIQECESDNAEHQAQDIRRLAEGRIQGLILPPPLSGSELILAELKSLGVPVATIATSGVNRNSLNVRIDDFGAAAEMTSYLLKLGHRNIGFIKGHPNQVASHDRLHGFVSTMARHGINPELLPLAQGYFTYRSALTAADRLLSSTELPTAIFASNDDMGAAVLAVAHRRGLRVPEDLTVVGFDDTALATIVWPQLTTVRQPIEQMAQTAVKLLLQRLEKSSRPGSTVAIERVLKHEIVVRESSAAPSHRQLRSVANAVRARTWGKSLR